MLNSTAITSTSKSNFTKKHKKFIMPAGEYWIGDLCYVLDRKNWLNICDQMHTGHEDGTYETPEISKIAIFETRVGDGLFSDQNGSNYSVDSGTLGCINIQDIKSYELFHLGKTHKFDTYFYCFRQVVQTGQIKFGELVITTGWSEAEFIPHPSLIGEKINRLTILAAFQLIKDPKLTLKTHCLCDCGKDIIAAYHEDLKSGNVKSCGCEGKIKKMNERKKG